MKAKVKAIMAKAVGSTERKKSRVMGTSSSYGNLILYLLYAAIDGLLVESP